MVPSRRRRSSWQAATRDRSAPAHRRTAKARLERFSLAIDAIDRMPRFRVTGSSAREALLNRQIECKNRAHELGVDPPDIANWQYRSALTKRPASATPAPSASGLRGLNFAKIYTEPQRTEL
jgi:XFP-like protein